MTPPTRRHAIYNPGLLKREELIAGFVARTAMLDYLVDDLRQGGRQHHLIIGQRGTGKTTLLLRLACAIEDDEHLAKQAIALRFPEEQYNVARLSDFWLNCLDALVDALEQRGEKEEARRLDARISELDPLPEEERRAQSLSALVGWAERAERLVVLLVDNVDIVLDRLTKDHWSLREILSQQRRLVLVGASSKFLEESSDYQAAFYEFFNLHELGALNEEEARKMILRLAEQLGTPQVVEMLEQAPGRLQALLVLSGGTPRTLMLLHGILAQGSTERAEDDLEALLDQLTPYYKARFDDLSPQSQQVVDAVALHWHPITAAECDAKVRLGINATSAQLHRLVKQGVLSRSAGADSPRLTFQISERFFNIWYLMRASRRLRRRLLWLVGFLQSFYGEAEIEKHAAALIAAEPERAKDPARLLAFASAVGNPQLRRHLEFHAVQQLLGRQKPLQRWDELLDLEGEDRHLARMIERVQGLSQTPPDGSGVTTGEHEARRAEIVRLLARSPALSFHEKQQLASAERYPDEELLEALRRSDEQHRAILGDKLLAAIGTGELPSFPDIAGSEDRLAILFSAETELQKMSVLLTMFADVDWSTATDEHLRRVASSPELVGLVLMGVGARATRSPWSVTSGVLGRIVTHCVPEPDHLAFAPVFWRPFVEQGHGSEVAQILHDRGKHELALPLYEALRAAGAGQRAPLLHLAPEVRAPAEQILMVLLGGASEPAPPPEPLRSSSRRASDKPRKRAASK